MHGEHEMLGSIVSLILLFLFFSLLCSAATEMVAAALKMRALNLRHALSIALQDQSRPDLVDDFYHHPLTQTQINRDLPSYINPSLFVETLLDLLLPSTQRHNMTMEWIRGEIKATTSDSDINRILLILCDRCDGSIASFKQEIEYWFEASMQRATGWYKRKIQLLLFLVAVLITTSANLNTLEITNQLLSHTTSVTASKAVALPFLQGSMIPEGSIGFYLIGWLLSALALSLGAPFWFDALKRISEIRYTGKIA